MPEIAVRFPVQGIVRAVGLAKQPQHSTDIAVNVRVTDPITGRVRGGSRSGTTKHNSVAGGARIDKLAQLVYQNKLGTYAYAGTQNGAGEDEYVITQTEIELPKPSAGGEIGGSACMVTDDQGNVYCSPGDSRLLKLNGDGEIVWSISLPLKGEEQRAGAITVDNFGTVFVASLGPRDSTASTEDNGRLFAVVEDEKSDPQILWTLDTDYQIANLKFLKNQLICAVNQNARWTSYVVILDQVSAAAPSEKRRWKVPYPVSGLALTKYEAIILSHPEFENRYLYPVPSGDAGTVWSPVVSWTPKQLPDWKNRVWCWLDSHNIDGFNNETLEDKDEVELWKDISGHNRNLYVPEDQSQYRQNAYYFRGPEYVAESFYGGPALRFFGDDYPLKLGETKKGRDPGDPVTAMASAYPGNASYTKENRGQQTTVLPAYTGCKFRAFVVFRVPGDSRVHIGGGTAGNNSAGTPCIMRAGCVFAQETRKGSSKESDKHAFRAILDNVADWTPAHPDDAYWTGFASLDELGGNVRVRDQYVTAGATLALTDYFHHDIDLATNGSQHSVLVEWKWDSAANANGYAKFFDKAGTNYNAGTVTAIGNSSAQRTWLGYYTWHAGTWMVSGGGFPTNLSADDWHVPFGGEVLEIIVVDETDAGSALSATETDKLRGYLCWKYGMQGQLGVGTTYSPNNAGGPQGPPSKKDGTDDQTAHDITWTWRGGMLTKWWANGRLRWGLRGPYTTASALTHYGGIGDTVIAMDKGRRLVTTGPLETQDGDGKVWAFVRSVYDNGATVSVTGTGTWAWPATNKSGWKSLVTDAAEIIFGVADEFENVYIPWAFATERGIKVFTKTGVWLFDVKDTDGTNPAATLAVAVGPKTDYQDQSGTIKARRHVWAAATSSQGTSTADQLLAQWELVTFTPSSPGTPRQFNLIAIVDGAFYRVPSGVGAWVAINDDLSVAQAFTTGGHYVGAADMKGELFFVNGEEEFVYNPIRSPNWEPGDTSVEACVKWIAKSSGKLPRLCKLLVRTMGRLWLARPAEDPQQWFCSAILDPYDWNFLPKIPNLSQAIAGVNSEIGSAPDIVNALIPWTDDRIVFGCDHSIWVIAGNPMLGGAFDAISTVYGTAFGASSAMDPDGVIYVAGSRGGILRVAPSGHVQDMTKNTLGKAIDDINLSTYRMELVWNEKDDGLHVFLVPWSTHAAVVRHFFWERRADAWAEDEWSADAIAQQPTCSLTVDGDAYNDRRLLLGSQDGYVRYWNRDQYSDDGIEIPSTVRIGPIVPDEAGGEWKFNALKIALADTQGVCYFRFYVTDRADSVGEPVRQGLLKAGRNPVIQLSATGSYAYLELTAAINANRWALESISIDAEPVGIRRAR